MTDENIQQPEEKLPEYEAPTVVTYTEDQILEELGPAQTFYGNEGQGLPMDNL